MDDILLPDEDPLKETDNNVQENEALPNASTAESQNAPAGQKPEANLENDKLSQIAESPQVLNSPKQTVLGKLKAKQRLQAFLSPKTNAISPTKKKDADVLTKFNKKPKKVEKKISVIDEIELIKKEENDILHAIEAEMNERKRKSPTREEPRERRPRFKERNFRKRQSRSRSRTKSPEQRKRKLSSERYPKTWQEMRDRKLSLDDIKLIKNGVPFRPSKSCYDFRKQLLFNDPVEVNPLKVKVNAGPERSVPATQLRYTKQVPSISFSVTPVKYKPSFITHDEAIDFMPKQHRDVLKRLRDTSGSYVLTEPSKKLPRKWYPKITLPSISEECELLEPSLGLAILQNYSDEEEEGECEDTESTEQEKTLEESKINESQNSVDLNIEKSPKINKQISLEVEETVEEKPEEETEELHEEKSKKKKKKKKTTDEEEEVFKSKKDKKQKKQKEGKVKLKEEKEQKKKEEKDRKKEEKERKKEEKERKKEEKDRKKEEKERKKEEKVRKKAEEERKTAEDEKKKLEEEKKKAEEERNRAETERKKEEIDKEEKRKKDRDRKREDKSRYKEKTDEDSERLRKNKKDEKSRRTRSTSGEKYSTPKNKEKPRDEHESSDKKSEKKQRDSSTSRDRKDEKTKTPKRSKLATLDSYYDDFESLSTTEAITKPVPEAKTTDSVAKPSVDQKDSKKSRRESKSPHRDPNDGKLEGRKRDTEDRSLERKENGDDSKSKSARKEKTENLKTESRPPIKDDKTDKSTRDRKDKRRSKEATPNRRDKMRKRSVDHKRNQATKQECETPDTEEYHSHWESDTDMGNTQSYSPKPKLDTSWESDEELSRNSKKSRRHHEPELSPQYSFDRRSKKTSSVERSLEMPFNIKHVSRISDSRNIDGTLENSRMYSDDGWGDCSNYMNIGDLEAEKLRHEMEVLNHERKILEMEKRLVAEKLRNTEMGYVDFEENLLQDSSRYDYEEIKESKKSYKKSTDNYYKEKSYERTPKRPKHEPSTDRSHPEHTPPQDEEPKKAYDSNSRVRSEKTKRKRSRWEEDDVEQTVVKHKKLEREELEETEEKANSTCDDSNVTSNSIDKALLENEYEEFLKAVTTDIVVEKVKKEKSRRKKKLREKKRKLKGKKRRRYSTSSSSSSSSSSDSSSSDSSSSSSSSSTSTSESSRESRKKKKKKQKKKKTQKPIKLTKPIIENLSELEIGPCQTISIKQEKNVVDYDYELTVETVAPVPKIVPAPMSGALGLLPVKIEKDIDVDSTTSAVKSVPLIPTKFLTAVPLLNKEVMLQEVEVMSEEVVAEKPVEAVEQEVEMVNEEMVESGFSRVSEDEPMPEPTLGYPFSITLKQKPVIKETVGEPAGVFTDKLLQKSEHTTTTTREEKPNNEQTKPTPDKKDYIKQSPKHRSISPPQNKHQKDPQSSPIHRRPSPIRRRPSPRRRISPRSRELSPKSREHRQRRSVSPRHRRSTISPRNRKNLSPRSRRSISPRGRRNLSPRNRNLSPRNRNLSPRSRRSPSPRLNRGGLGFGQRRRSPSPWRKRSLSPHHGKRLRSNSPKRYNRSPSPRRLSKNYNRSYSRSPSMKREPIQVTLQRLASGGEDFSKSPSINSPVDGFKRSVADSTISDDQLLQQNADSVGESPTYAGSTFQRRIASSPMSPKRVPLDVRINQVLGIEKESPKPISTTYQNYSFDYSEQYSYGGAVQYPVDHSKGPPRGVNRSHVVQMGNVLEVVPTDNLNMSANVPKHIPSQKIVQVGNMLQIVPTPSPVAPPDVPLPVQPVAPPVMIPVVPISPARSMAAPLQSMENLIPPAMVQKPSPEDVMKLKMAERRAERQKRHEERELKRKEKEKRKKEREKKQQLKIKQKNENMIRALKIETEAMAFGENAEENEEGNEAVFWPGALGTLSSPILKPAGKGILMTRGFSKINLDEDGYSERKKRVKFADGIVPGEGTSPSGGEELSSPPPFQPTLPKEKRFKKIKKKKVKVPKKKKIKVKIIRKPSPTSPNDDDEDEDGLDSLPPPSPPPGSPPPHVYPARIKSHGINNVHPNYNGGVPFLPVAGSYQQPQQQQQQVQFRPTLPPLNMPPPPPHGPPHHGPPHHGPPPHGPPHHVPPPHGPPHHGPPPPHGPPHHGPPHIPPGPPHRPPHGAPPGRPF